MNKKLNDKELENVTGGSTEDESPVSEGGICPINGKYCKHGVLISIIGYCINADEGIGTTPQGEDYTYKTCEYINDQE